MRPRDKGRAGSSQRRGARGTAEWPAVSIARGCPPRPHRRESQSNFIRAVQTIPTVRSRHSRVRRLSGAMSAAKTVAIVQSCYIPWKGYFDLIALADEFYLYDDAEY